MCVVGEVNRSCVMQSKQEPASSVRESHWKIRCRERWDRVHALEVSLCQRQSGGLSVLG